MDVNERNYKGLWGNFWGIVDIFFILIRTLFSWKYTYVRTHQMCAILCINCNSKNIKNINYSYHFYTLRKVVIAWYTSTLILCFPFPKFLDKESRPHTPLVFISVKGKKVQVERILLNSTECGCVSPFCAEWWGRQARQRIQRDVFSTFIQLIRQDKNIHDCKPKTDTGRERIRDLFAHKRVAKKNTVI